MNLLKPILIMAVAYVAIYLQATVEWIRHVAGGQVNVLPALMVYAGLSGGLGTITMLALFGGLGYDSFSANPPGASVLPLFCIGVALHVNRDVLLRENPFAQWVLGCVAGAVAPLATLFLLFNLGQTPLLGWKTLWQCLVMAAGGGVLTPVCFRLFDRFERMFAYQRHSPPPFRRDREIKHGRM